MKNFRLFALALGVLTCAAFGGTVQAMESKKEQFVFDISTLPRELQEQKFRLVREDAQDIQRKIDAIGGLDEYEKQLKEKQLSALVETVPEDAEVRKALYEAVKAKMAAINAKKKAAVCEAAEIDLGSASWDLISSYKVEKE